MRSSLRATNTALAATRSRGGLAATLAAPSSTLIGDTDYITVKLIGGDPSAPRIDVSVRRDSYAFYCSPYHLFVTDASTGEVLGHALVADSMGVDCFDDVSIPLSSYDGNVELHAYAGSKARDAIEEEGVGPGTSFRSSGPFEVVSTDEGRDRGVVEDEEGSIIPSFDEASTALGDVRGLVKWSAILAGGAAGMYFLFPALQAGREITQEALE